MGALCRMHAVGCCCSDWASLLELDALVHLSTSLLSGRRDSISCPEGDALPCAIWCLSLLPWAVAIFTFPACSHGAPRPEDDPANFEGGKRVRGPSEEEVNKAREERRKVSVARLVINSLA